METQNEKTHNGFSQGLLLGLVLGVCLTLLFVTKRGRRVLRSLTKEGMENIAGLSSRFKGLDSYIDEDLYYDDVEETIAEKAPAEKSQTTSKPESNGVKKHAKRLFRGIPRKN